MLTNLYDSTCGIVLVRNMVTDDESTLQSHCRKVKSGEHLNDNIPQPVFLADPTHRIKVICKPIFRMVSDTKDPGRCKNIDALRIIRYTSYCVFENRTTPLNKFVESFKAPIGKIAVYVTVHGTGTKTCLTLPLIFMESNMKRKSTVCEYDARAINGEI